MCACMRIFVRGPPSKEEFRFVSWWKLRGRKEEGGMKGTRGLKMVI